MENIKKCKISKKLKNIEKKYMKTKQLNNRMKCKLYQNQFRVKFSEHES